MYLLQYFLSKYNDLRALLWSPFHYMSKVIVVIIVNQFVEK